MTENLRYTLTAGENAIGSDNSGTEFIWIPESCEAGGACAMNGNTTAIYATNSTKGTAELTWYYSWYAATAGRGRNEAVNNTDIDGSVCPAHWKVPYNYVAIVDGVSYSAHDKSYSALFAAYGMNTSGSGRNYLSILDYPPLNFVRVGSAINGGSQYTADAGFYWSSTYHSNADAWRVYYHSATLTPQIQNGMDHGMSVRCVAL